MIFVHTFKRFDETDRQSSDDWILTSSDYYKEESIMVIHKKLLKYIWDGGFHGIIMTNMPTNWPLFRKLHNWGWYHTDTETHDEKT